MDFKTWFWGCEASEKEAFERIKTLSYKDFQMRWIGGKSFADIHIYHHQDLIAYIEMKVRGFDLESLFIKGDPFFWPQRNEGSDFFHEYERNKELLHEEHWDDALCCCVEKNNKGSFYLTTAKLVAKSVVLPIFPRASAGGGVCYTYQASSDKWTFCSPDSMLMYALILLGKI